MGQYQNKEKIIMKEITFDYENAGGLLEIIAIPPTSFRRVRIDYSTRYKYLEVINRDDIIRIPMFADDSFSFSEDSDYADGGLIYDISIDGIIPKKSQANDSIIHELERGEWYVVALDNNNVVHLCGTDDVLMTFKTQKTTNATYAELNKIAFSFTNKQSKPSQIIQLDKLSDI